jgi:YidC/Oxa1 family membrane protein insertase
LSDWLELVLGYIQNGLEQLHLPYTYGWSIILLTLLVKTALLPITKKQVESGIVMQNLKPTIDNIKRLYGDDKEKIQRETAALYEKAKVNPLAGCLPALVTIPVFIGLYNSLSNVAASGKLAGEGFYWLPSLAGPTTIAARRAGSATAWLYPFVDGHPPIGWEEASKYLVLPVLLVVAQYASTAIISPPVDPNDDNAKTTKTLLAFLPLMVGWFALQVPSGLSLYYFSNTVLTSAQQIWLRKLGGASAIPYDLGPIDIGKARRTGEVATTEPATEAQAAADLSGNGSSPALAEASAQPLAATQSNLQGQSDNGVVAVEQTVAAALPSINRRCKRKKRELLEATA